jgi:hypothetical protein
MKITVIGTGYVGLVSGACLADVGNDVLCLDLDASKIRVLEEGGTPPDEDGSADLQYVLAAARNIGRHMTDYKVIATKSTVPVGTGDKVRQAMEEIKTIVAKYGLKLGEVMGQPAARKPRVGAKKIAEKPAKKPAAASRKRASPTAEREAFPIKEALNSSSHRRKPVSSALILLDSGFRRNDDMALDQCFLKLGATALSAPHSLDDSYFAL